LPVGAGQHLRGEFLVIRSCSTPACDATWRKASLPLRASGRSPADAPQLKVLLALYPSEEMVAWPVSPRVGNVKNNDPS
jgi:hypothetical protein